MKDGTPEVDAHAYVDNCLTPEERKAFEASLRQDEDLRRRVELWQSQSAAIRAAFGESGRNLRPNLSVLRAGPGRTSSPSAAAPLHGETSEVANRSVPPSRISERSQPRWATWARRPATLAVLALTAGLLLPGGMANEPQGALADTGGAAFRAFSVSPASALDVHGGDVEDLSRMLGPSFVAARLPEWVAPLGWTLRGAKRVPGLQGEAVLILLEGKEGRPLGVLVEPLDAPASSAIRAELRGGVAVAVFARRGYGFAVAGPAYDEVAAWLSASGFLDEGWPHPIR